MFHESRSVKCAVISVHLIHWGAVLRGVSRTLGGHHSSKWVVSVVFEGAGGKNSLRSHKICSDEQEQSETSMCILTSKNCLDRNLVRELIM